MRTKHMVTGCTILPLISRIRNTYLNSKDSEEKGHFFVQKQVNQTSSALCHTVSKFIIKATKRLGETWSELVAVDDPFTFPLHWSWHLHWILWESRASFCVRQRRRNMLKHILYMEIGYIYRDISCPLPRCKLGAVHMELLPPLHGVRWDTAKKGSRRYPAATIL